MKRAPVLTGAIVVATGAVALAILQLGSESPSAGPGAPGSSAGVDVGAGQHGAERTPAQGAQQLVRPMGAGGAAERENVAREGPAAWAPEPSTPRRGSLAEAIEWLRALDPGTFGELTEAEALALTTLDLRSKPIEDADLAHLAALPRLATLNLRGTPITNEGLVHLSYLGQLTWLELRATQVSGEGLHLLPLQLEALHLTDTAVTGEDLVRLPYMADLRTLKLNFLELGDEAIESLAAYTSLAHIELDRTAITEQGLELLLEQHPGVARLELRNTAIGNDKLQELRERYPECEFIVDSPGLQRRFGR